MIKGGRWDVTGGRWLTGGGRCSICSRFLLLQAHILLGEHALSGVGEQKEEATRTTTEKHKYDENKEYSKKFWIKEYKSDGFLK